MLVGRLGEEALLKELRSLFAVTSGGVPTGIGDDAAVIDLPPGYQMAWSTDLLLEGVHFQMGWQTPRDLGYKALAVNISDIASMGANPLYALLSLACPPDSEVEDIIGLCQGFCDLAVNQGIAVVGGDTTASREGLVISVTLGGLSASGKALLRSGAKPGDAVVVTGFLGSAAAGLRLLMEPAADRYDSLREAFLRPRPMVAVAQAALKSGATSMTDISDGLASDLRHICSESGVGARLFRDKVPVHPELKEAAGKLGWDLSSLVLSGGEDYSLLFTIPRETGPAAAREIEKETGTRIHIIGEIRDEPGIVLVDENGTEEIMQEKGFDHFTGRGEA